MRREPVPGPLRPLVARGIAKDPWRRPADADHLRYRAQKRSHRVTVGQDSQERRRSHLARGSPLAGGTVAIRSLTDSGGVNIFVAKYDSSGNVQWAKSATGNGYDYSYGICTDSNSNVYITGMFQGSIIFGSSTLTNSVYYYYNIFLAKYDSDGNVLWAKGMGEGEFNVGQGICTDVSGNVYITGFFQDKIIFGNDTLIYHGVEAIFLAKIDAYGNNIWAKSPPEPYGGNYISSSGIAADISGNVYITG